MGWVKGSLAAAALVGIVGVTGATAFEIGKVRGAEEEKNKTGPRMLEAEREKLIFETVNRTAWEKDESRKENDRLRLRIVELENEIAGKWEKLMPSGSDTRCVNGQTILKKGDSITSLGPCA
jgi:hypothetical protein